MTEFVSPHLRTVLKTYQNSATKSLQGPGNSLSSSSAVHHHNNIINNSLSLSSNATIVKKEVLSSPEPLELNESSSLIVHPPPPPELPQPILTAPDTGRGELYETVLEGKTIGCFYLGGEMRLCLPQFLNNVLTDFTLDQINREFDELRIFCSQCTPEQLMEFKSSKILPEDVKASGLITRTDAERLCSALLHRSERNNYCLNDIPKGAISFKVYHRCFGKCEGICTPDLYSFSKPSCITCLECKDLFSPQKFVGHAHHKQENRTCHWGFDSRNWHDYLHVALDEKNRDKYTKMLDDLHELEEISAQRDMNILKRKADFFDEASFMLRTAQCKREPLDIPPKKAKILNEQPYLLDIQRYQQAMYLAHCAREHHNSQMSAFRPWAPRAPLLQLPYTVVPLPYLTQEPPVLQNPERVVRHADSEQFECTYQPNVALAPRKSILSKEREKERGRERERDREREREKERERDRHRIQHIAAIKNLVEPELIIKQERSNSPDAIAQSPEEIRIVSPTLLNINSSNINTNDHQQKEEQQRRSSLHSHYSNDQQSSMSSASSTSSVASLSPQQNASNSSNHNHKLSQLPLSPSHHPISPEEISGSNEITSSTSPVPNNNNGCNNKNINNNRSSPIAKTTTAQQLQQQQILLQHKQLNEQKSHIKKQQQYLNPTPVIDNNNSTNIVCFPNRIRISKNLLNNSNVVRSRTPSPPLALLTMPSPIYQDKERDQYLTVSASSAQKSNKSNNCNNNKSLSYKSRNIVPYQQHQTPSQSSSTMSSSNNIKTLSTQSTDILIKRQQQHILEETSESGVLVKNNQMHSHTNNNINAINPYFHTNGAMDNTEFDSSNNTDEESLNGEPDSSNLLSAWDLAADILKDTQPNVRDKVLQIIQQLTQDNIQLRQNRFDHMKLLQKIRLRDEQILSLQKELQTKNFNLFSSPILGNNYGVIAKIDGTSSRNEVMLSPSSTAAMPYLPNANNQSTTPKTEFEKIKVPLKKSLRRSPIDSVVVLNQNHNNRDDTITEIKIETKSESLSPEILTGNKSMTITPIVISTTPSTTSIASVTQTMLTPTSLSSPDSVVAQIELKHVGNGDDGEILMENSTGPTICIKTEQ